VLETSIFEAEPFGAELLLDPPAEGSKTLCSSELPGLAGIAGLAGLAESSEIGDFRVEKTRYIPKPRVITAPAILRS